MSRNTEPCIGQGPIVHQLSLHPGARPIDAPSDRSVLASARAAGVELHASCRNGTCRACLRRLHSGQVHYRIEWPGLSAEEKAEGFILPCVAHPACDLVLVAQG
jgi:ferredoxin